ncbi:hypothetical protein GCM10022232_40850 [Streptomyces plumbiresistens]|uniref:Uncharacterized protein n=1 Tax=Streptomyces plumbiresistens TaxID=511811 RepID=A0ABP7RL77_9ACTN
MAAALSESVGGPFPAVRFLTLAIASPDRASNGRGRFGVDRRGRLSTERDEICGGTGSGSADGTMRVGSPGRGRLRAVHDRVAPSSPTGGPDDLDDVPACPPAGTAGAAVSNSPTRIALRAVRAAIRIIKQTAR